MSNEPVLADFDRVEAGRRSPSQRERAEALIQSLIDEAVNEHNRPMLRGNLISMAALKFAYEGTAHQHGALAREENKGLPDVDAIAQIVGGVLPFGVTNPTEGEIRSFVDDVSAYVHGLRIGNLVDAV